MKTIAIANQKGGVAKSTTCWEIGSCIGDLGLKVLIIDFDQQANLTGYVNAEKDKATIYDVLKAEISIEDAIQHLDDFDFIAASEKLSKADKEFSAPEDIYLLKLALSYVEDRYDYVIIDNSPSRNALLNMSYVASNYVIIPTECDTGSIDGIEAIYGDIQKYRKLNWTQAQVSGILLTKFENTAMHTFALEQINVKANEMEEEPFVATIRKSVKASESKLAMQSLQRYEKYCNPAIDYRNVTKKLLEKIGEEK